MGYTLNLRWCNYDVSFVQFEDLHGVFRAAMGKDAKSRLFRSFSATHVIYTYAAIETEEEIPMEISGRNYHISKPLSSHAPVQRRIFQANFSYQ